MTLILHQWAWYSEKDGDALVEVAPQGIILNKDDYISRSADRRHYIVTGIKWFQATSEMWSRTAVLELLTPKPRV